MKVAAKKIVACTLVLLMLSSCSYNPFVLNNDTTGSPVGAVVGAGVGAGSIALLNGPKWLMVAAGLGGGAIGYYATTLRNAAGGIIQGGGQVYHVGDYIGIYIPSDSLFEPNTADFLPTAYPILASVAAVLNRYPNENIMVSGSTSGFYRPWWEQRLTEQRRAQRISAYLWKEGVSQFKTNSNGMRKLNYVGYGDYFPISNTFTNKGIRENSRVQITVYPSNTELGLDKRSNAMRNIGADVECDPANDSCD